MCCFHLIPLEVGHAASCLSMGCEQLRLLFLHNKKNKATPKLLREIKMAESYLGSWSEHGQ